MKTEDTKFVHAIIIAFALVFVSAQSPPQLLSTIGNPQKIVTPGSPVTLPCPVHGDRDTLIFEWYKDRESLESIVDTRMRISSNGSLRIKKVNAEDTGLFTCRAVNGFGSVEYNATLIVLGGDDDYDSDSDDDNVEDFDAGNGDSSTHKISRMSKPHLLYVTEVGTSPLHQLPGSSLELHCVASGHPRPQVTWFKDGQELPQALKRGRWTLRLRKLTTSDGGNFTCVVTNIVGSTSHSFFIEVSADGSRGKPQLTGTHPSNTTVEEGNIAVLQCVVWSDSTPQIEWLKRVEEVEMNQDEIQKLIRVEGESFRVLESSPVMDRSDGSYLNKLVIRKAQQRDAGKYVCLGANTNGYSFRSAFLTVVPRPTSPTEPVPFPIVVAVIVVGVAVVAGIVALLIYCRSRHASTGGSSTGVPMVTKDAFLPMHLRPTTVARCGNVSYPPVTPLAMSHPEVTVYVPSCPVSSGR